MEISPQIIIVLLSSIVILSYVFNLISRMTKIPSVLLLLATGVGIKYATHYFGYVKQDVDILVKILGVVGIIMIVLEAALDIVITRDKLKIIRDSALLAFVTFVLSSLGVAYLLHWWLSEPLSAAILYAVPMSIISSAIVIPSTGHLPETKKDFIIYESSFSDIMGIMAFNYLLGNDVLSLKSLGAFSLNVGIAVLISIIASLVMLFMLTKIKFNLKFFLMYAILALVYSIGEMFSLPSLLIVLVFGLVLNNSRFFLRGPFARLTTPAFMFRTLQLMQSITAETSFLIRTFFFILFGYTIDLELLVAPNVIVLGSLIVVLLLIIRFLYLRLILRRNLFPELFLMPRGLITVLMFYSIPAGRTMNSFNIGVLFFVVVVTSLIMMVGLLVFKTDSTAKISEYGT